MVPGGASLRLRSNLASGTPERAGIFVFLSASAGIQTATVASRSLTKNIILIVGASRFCSSFVTLFAYG